MKKLLLTLFTILILTTITACDKAAKSIFSTVVYVQDEKGLCYAVFSPWTNMQSVTLVPCYKVGFSDDKR